MYVHTCNVLTNGGTPSLIPTSAHSLGIYPYEGTVCTYMYLYKYKNVHTVLTKITNLDLDLGLDLHCRITPFLSLACVRSRGSCFLCASGGNIVCMYIRTENGGSRSSVR